MSESDLWYFRRGEQKGGPVTFAQLCRRAARGELQPDDHVRSKEDPKWRRAGTVTGLFDAPKKAAKPQKSARGAIGAAILAAGVLAVVALVGAGIAAFVVYQQYYGARPPVADAAFIPPVALGPPMRPPQKGPALGPVVKDQPGKKPAEQPAPQAPAEKPAPTSDPAKLPAPAALPTAPPMAPPVAPPVPAEPLTGAAAFVYMEKADVPQNFYGYTGLLGRELWRQAVLMAARDEFGLSTRDELLGEVPPEGMPAKNRLRATSFFRSGVVLRVAAECGPREARVPICKVELPLKQEFQLIHGVGGSNRWAMIDVVKGLKAAGFTGKPNAWAVDLPVPSAIEEQLEQMTFTSQYQAIRMLHTLMHEKGESPMVLGALVRGYANLGLLTEFHWAPAHKVFKARSLLYAARLHVRLTVEAGIP
jgi:GYF domain 2